MSEEDKLEYKCQHCDGEVSIDVEMSSKDWRVFKCSSCESKSPLSVEDLMHLAEQP